MFSRRQLLRTGAIALAAAVPAATLSPAGPAMAADAVNPSAVPAGPPVIDVSHGSTKWLAGVTNHDTSTTLQGFAFDSVNGHFYTSQIAGASQVAYLRSGAQVAITASLSGDNHAGSGDLCITKHDLTGAVKGVMYLLGFGHGVSIGVEPATSSTPAYLWTEANAGTNGFGNEIARFPFIDKTVLWTSHPSVKRLRPPDPGVTSSTPSVDAAYGILLLRYVTGGAHWFAAYDLAAARSAILGGTVLPAPLAKIQQPFLAKPDANGQPTTTAAVFQGFTSSGPYLYLLDGESRTSDPTLPLTGYDQWTVHTTSVDLNGTRNDPATGYIARTHSEADAAANPREPEGMAVYTGTGGPRLCFGLTNNLADGTRQFDLYYKI
jgi:hypothetical protein